MSKATPLDQETAITYLTNGDRKKRAEWLFEQCGYGASAKDIDWLEINTILNEALNLNQHPHTIEVMSLIDEALARTIRFRHNRHITTKYGDSTTAHQKQAMLELYDIFSTPVETNGKLIPAFYAKSGKVDKKGKPKVARSYRESILAMAIHDAGEIFGEATTVSQQATEERPPEIAKNPLEDLVTKFTVKLADYAIRAGNKQIFLDAVDYISANAQIADRGLEGLAVVPLLMKDFIEHYHLGIEVDKFLEQAEKYKRQEPDTSAPLWDRNPKVTPLNIPQKGAKYKVTRKDGEWDLLEHLKSYDAVEGEDNDSFIKKLVKIVERMQGTRYFTDKGGEEGTIPLSHTTSRQIVAGIYRLERELPQLFEFAKSPKQKTLARETVMRCYEAIIEQLSKISYALDRGVDPEHPPAPEHEETDPVQSHGDAKSRYRNQLKTLRDSKRERGFIRHNIESVNELLDYYIAALAGVENGTYRAQAGSTIIKDTTVPEKLLPIVKAVHEERKSSISRRNKQQDISEEVRIEERGQKAIKDTLERMRAREGRLPQ